MQSDLTQDDYKNCGITNRRYSVGRHSGCMVDQGLGKPEALSQMATSRQRYKNGKTLKQKPNSKIQAAYSCIFRVVVLCVVPMETHSVQPYLKYYEAGALTSQLCTVKHFILYRICVKSLSDYITTVGWIFLASGLFSTRQRY